MTLSAPVGRRNKPDGFLHHPGGEVLAPSTSESSSAQPIFAVGVALIFGLSVEISPQVYMFTPEALRPIFSSSTSLATILLVTLSLLFRMGVSKERRFVFHPGKESLYRIHDVMEEQGSTWGMRHEVERRAEHAVHEVMSTVMLNPFLRSADVILEFDELKLEVAVEYNGVGPVLSENPPSAEDLATKEGLAALSGFMIYSYADRARVKIKTKGNTWCRIQLQFDH